MPGVADMSMAANFNAQARIPKGPVTVREIAGLYVYENTLAVLEVTGRQLKDAPFGEVFSRVRARQDTHRVD